MASMMPTMLMIVDMPDMLDSSARFKRAYNKSVKAAMREVLNEHHRKRIPKHFIPPAKGKYKHKPRGKRYNEHKRRRGIRADLISADPRTSGRTRIKMVHQKWKQQIGGVAVAGTLRARMHTRFPFPVSNDNTRPGTVKIRDMAREIASIAPDEVKEINEQLKEATVENLKEELRNAPRVRKRIEKATGVSL